MTIMTGFCAAAVAAAAISAASAAPKAASFEEFDRRAKAGEDALSVVFFGGSLTWGANASDPQRTSYRALMGQYLRQKYPRAPFTFHDAAIGGTGSQLGMFRLDRDVLARKPDLVFLDFTANDDHFGKDIESLASYEILVREMVGRGIPVVQALLPFQWNFMPKFNPEPMARYQAHLKLASAYHLAVGDTLPYIQKGLDEKRYTLPQLWPLDGVHPCDEGYQAFFEGVREGFDKAVTDKLVCTVPEKPVFSDMYATRSRIRLAAAAPLPDGWAKALTYRTSMWFDGLSSRWMDDVAVCDAKDAAKVKPLKVEFTGTFVGIFGEADEVGLSFKASVDGKVLPYHPDPKKPAEDAWPFTTKRFGVGRLFIWHVLARDLPPGKHVLEIQPVVPAEGGKGQLRIESVCAAGQ